MPFPDDYHINEAFCLKKNHGIHKWSTMGHPLRHRCNDCHKLKWVRDPEPQIEVRPGSYLFNVNRP